MSVKLNLDVLFDYNCREWRPYEIECDESTMTIKCVAKDKLHLRLINELSHLQAELETLKQETERLKNNNYSNCLNDRGSKLEE